MFLKWAYSTIPKYSITHPVSRSRSLREKQSLAPFWPRLPLPCSNISSVFCPLASDEGHSSPSVQCHPSGSSSLISLSSHSPESESKCEMSRPEQLFSLLLLHRLFTNLGSPHPCQKKQLTQVPSIFVPVSRSLQRAGSLCQCAHKCTLEFSLHKWFTMLPEGPRYGKLFGEDWVRLPHKPRI